MPSPRHDSSWANARQSMQRAHSTGHRWANASGQAEQPSGPHKHLSQHICQAKGSCSGPSQGKRAATSNAKDSH